MSTPQRILDSGQVKTFFEWFELLAVAFFLFIILAILAIGMTTLIWWLA